MKHLSVILLFSAIGLQADDATWKQRMAEANKFEREGQYAKSDALYVSAVKQAENGDRLVSVSAPGTASSVKVTGDSIDLPQQSLVDLSGPVPKIVLTGLSNPLSLTYDPVSRWLIVSDLGNHRIVILKNTEHTDSAHTDDREPQADQRAGGHR